MGFKVNLTLSLLFLYLSVTTGFVQKLDLHDDSTGNVYEIHDKVADTSVLPYWSNITRICFLGGWDFFSDVNYFVHAYSADSEEMTCVDQAFPYKSFRHIGANETEYWALTMYTGIWEGWESFIDVPGFNQHFQNVASLGYTGHENWTFYEGYHFNGNASCLIASEKGFGRWVASEHGIESVGSAKFGCLL